jgi:hypothetical protein
LQTGETKPKQEDLVDINIDETAETVERLNRDLRDSAKKMTANQARFLVDAYYIIQANRIRTRAQERALIQAKEPSQIIHWLGNNSQLLENQLKAALDKYSTAHPVGTWTRSVCGIGPVLSAGLLAHIDIEKAPTVGHIWAFAGLDPTKKWEKRTKRPWNANLKTLCWKIGESFVKQQGRDHAVYADIFTERKKLEHERNDAGKFANQAEEILKTRKINKATDAYKYYSVGKLPKAHIHARARRYAVKLFLAHFHEIAYINQYGKPPPLPYPIAHLEHVHKIDPN